MSCTPKRPPVFPRAQRVLMCLHPGEGRKVVGVRGGLPQGHVARQRLTATQEAHPTGGRPLAQAMPGRRSQAGLGPGTRLGLLGNPGAALSAFQRAPLLFPLLCSIHGPAPGPGGQAGGQASRAPSAPAWAQCPGTPAPALSPASCHRIPGLGLQNCD